QFDRAQQLLFTTDLEHVERPASGPNIHFAVGGQWRGPGFAIDFMSPTDLAGFRVDAMELASAIGNEDQAIHDRRRSHHVLLQLIRPNLPVTGDIAGPGGIDTLEPRLVFAPPEVAAAGQVDAISIEYGHAVEVAGANLAIAVEAMHVGFRRVGIEIELPHFIQTNRLGVREGNSSLWQRLESVENPVAAAEENQRFAVDVRQRRSAPSAVKNIGRHM